MRTKTAGALCTGCFNKLNYHSYNKQCIGHTVLAFATKSFRSLSDASCAKSMPSFCCNRHIVYELRPYGIRIFNRNQKLAAFSEIESLIKRFSGSSIMTACTAFSSAFEVSRSYLCLRRGALMEQI